MTERRDIPSDAEVRKLPVTETRASRDEDGNPDTIAVDVAVYDQLSHVLGPEGQQFREKIEPGALTPADEAEENGDVTSEFNHDPSQILGRKSAGNLETEERDTSLRFIVNPVPDTSYARDVTEAIDKDLVPDGSFAFRVPEGGDEWEIRDDGPDIRTINRAVYYEGGPVTHGAYPQTSADLRENVKPALESRSRALGEGPDPEHGADKVTENESEERQTDQDLRRLIADALREEFGGEDVFIFVESTFLEENLVVFNLDSDDESGLFRVSFEIDEDNNVTFGEPEEVMRVTEFEAVEENARSSLTVTYETRQSRPEFDGVEDRVPDWVDEGTWDRPDLSDHPEAGEGDDFSDLSEDEQNAVRGRFIEKEGDTYSDLSNPVVNPVNDQLNRNGVLAARQRPASDEAESIADALWEEHFAEDEDEENSLRERRMRLEALR